MRHSRSRALRFAQYAHIKPKVVEQEQGYSPFQKREIELTRPTFHIFCGAIDMLCIEEIAYTEEEGGHSHQSHEVTHHRPRRTARQHQEYHCKGFEYRERIVTYHEGLLLSLYIIME